MVASAARELLNKTRERALGRAVDRDVVPGALSRSDRGPTITRRCDWRIADLVDAEQPVTLYLVMPPSDISRTKPLVRLVLNQIGRRLTERLEATHGKSRKHRAADDARRVSRPWPARLLRDAPWRSWPAMASAPILIAQSLNQIDKAYGENNSILDNCHVRVAFATNDERTAKRISDALGTATEQRAQRTTPATGSSPWLAPRHGQPPGDRRGRC